MTDPHRPYTADGNRAHVRHLVADRQPGFTAALDQAEAGVSDALSGEIAADPALVAALMHRAIDLPEPEAEAEP